MKARKDMKAFSQFQQAVEIFTCYEFTRHTEKSLNISLLRIFEHLAGAQLHNWRQNKNENKTRNT